MRIWRGLKTLLFVVMLTMMASVASAQATSPIQVDKSPNTLTCSPAPCVLPNVPVDPAGASQPRAMVVNPQNPSQMVIAAFDGACGSSQGFYSTDNGGLWWKHSCTYSNDAVGEPVVGYDLNGVVYGGGLDGDTAVTLRYSTDNGIHWSPYKVVDGYGWGEFEPQLLLDANSSSPYKNSIYLTTLQGPVSGGALRIFVSQSRDSGVHWAGVPLDPWQHPDYDLFPRLSVGANGTVYATWMRCKPIQVGGFCTKNGVPIYLSRSQDGGVTWTSPSIVTKVNLVGPDDCLYACLPNTSPIVPVHNDPNSVAIDSGNNTKLHVVFYNWTGRQMQVEVITSADGGETFGPPVRVSNSNVGDQFAPWITASQDGKLVVSWLDRRSDPGNLTYQPFLATSNDGVHFSRSVRLASSASDPSAVWDFGGVVPAPSIWVGNAIYATWTDTRSGLPRTELGGMQF